MTTLVDEAQEVIQWVADFQEEMFSPAYYDKAWPVEMYGLADSASVLAKAYLDLYNALLPLAGEGEDFDLEGLHFVGDEERPEGCPGCIVRKALGLPTSAEVE